MPTQTILVDKYHTKQKVTRSYHKNVLLEANFTWKSLPANFSLNASTNTEVTKFIKQLQELVAYYCA
jgi:hypothetical protein